MEDVREDPDDLVDVEDLAWSIDEEEIHERLRLALERGVERLGLGEVGEGPLGPLVAASSGVLMPEGMAVIECLVRPSFCSGRGCCWALEPCRELCQGPVVVAVPLGPHTCGKAGSVAWAMMWRISVVRL